MSIDTSTLKNWIRENPEKAQSVKVVAVHLGLNVDYARREFHRKEGMTFGQFVSDVFGRVCIFTTQFTSIQSSF
jgi:methylphosphotriester-DNA--protein-cysteine methyltransferase